MLGLRYPVRAVSRATWRVGGSMPDTGGMVAVPSPTLEALAADPHPWWHALRGRGPVAWVDAVGGWVVLSRALALEVMRDPVAFTVDDPRFSTARVVGPSMLSLDGAAHDRHRAPFARAFRRDAVHARLGEVVREEADRLLDAAAEQGEADLRTAFAAPLAAAVMGEVLGLGRPVEDVLRWYGAIVAAVDAAAPDRPVDRSGAAAFAELAAAIGDDVAGAGGDLSREETVSNAAILLFGGIETTEGAIASALWHLLGAPDALASVRADAGLVPAAVEESARLEPAAARVDRYATRDVDLAGAPVAAGDLVVVSISAANRDPAVFADPDRFDLRRADVRRHVTFAAGPHVCLGMHLARLEAHVAIERVLTRFPAAALSDPEAAAPRGLVFRKPPELRVRLT
jgi:cytochrome P450